MKKILLISGSNRNGNTNYLLKQIEQKIDNTELILLSKCNIEYCKGCLACHKIDKCVIKDDISELYEEGRKLSHCVGTYGKTVAEGRSVIAFIRKQSEVDTPLCTIEIRQDAIVQARGMSNRPAENIPKMKGFINAWAKNKGLIYAA